MSRWPIPQQYFKRALVGFLLSQEGRRFKSDFGFDEGGRISWIRLGFRLDILEREEASVLLPISMRWQSAIDELQSNVPVALQNIPINQTSEGWVWLETEQALRQSALSGLTVSVLVAAVIVTCFSRNIRLSIIVFGVLVLSVSAVLAIAVLLGWKLGK